MKRQPLSNIDLIILGFLLEEPMSAYDLACAVEERHASKLVKISAPTVYKNCLRLFSQGFITVQPAQESDHSEKAIYVIAKKGRERFVQLMTHFSSEIEPFFLNCNAALYHLEKLDKRDGLKMLESLHDAISKRKAWIIQHEKEEVAQLPFPNRAIVKQYRMVLTTLCEWSAETLREYKLNKKKPL